jgi:aldose 1-epimerase
MAHIPNDHTAMPVMLQSGAAACEIWPALGGSIGAWTIRGQDMMRRASADAIAQKQPLGMASFPLVPYSNRIGFGRFDWAGRIIDVAPNFPPEPHAIHGTGWTSAWTYDVLGPDQIILRHIHGGDAQWPWPFKAEQHITLQETMLSIAMEAWNVSDEPAPLAFGHHPYFDSDGATLSFHAAQVWQTGDDGLPHMAQPPQGRFDFGTGEPVSGRGLDHGYAGWGGKATISWTDRPMMLDIESDMAAAVVYAPDPGNCFCFEPVPHIINALNLPDQQPQMPIVAAGTSFRSSIRFKARPSL